MVTDQEREAIILEEKKKKLWTILMDKAYAAANEAWIQEDGQDAASGA